MSYGDRPETVDYIDHLEAENERLRDENTQLESQLTWRYVSEKPEEGRVLIIENGRVLAVTYEMDDGAYYFLDDDGFECYPSKWLPIPKEN